MACILVKRHCAGGLSINLRFQPVNLMRRALFIKLCAADRQPPALRVWRRPSTAEAIIDDTTLIPQYEARVTPIVANF